jgi:serine/threonine protein phosphatase PrpC
MQSNSPYWQEFLEHAELTDVGLRRANNQDSMACMLAGNEADFFRRGHIFVVADGMGRHAAGELASKISVDTIPLEFFKEPNATPPVALKAALEEGNRRIHARGGQNPDFKGMGTTTSALTLLPQGAVVAHVGDSRVYRLRGKQLEQLTFDHSVVWELRAAAKAGGVEVPANVPKNFITRSLGHDPNVQVDLEGPFPLAEGDVFLLCSDGLSGQLEDQELGILLGCLKPAEAARVLIDIANLRGGPDNITVLIAKVGSLSRVSAATPPKDAGSGLAWGKASPAVWVAFGTLLLLAGILFVAGQPIAGAVCAVAALVVGFYVLATITTGGGGGRSHWAKTPLGRGPHTSTPCAPDDAFVARIAAMVHQLRESAVQQNWTIDWRTADAGIEKATAARNAGKFGEAVRHYALALSFLMAEIRKQRQLTPANDVLDDMR